MDITAHDLFLRLDYIHGFEYVGGDMTDYLVQANLLKALAHPMRLQILDLLRSGETCVCHIERKLGKRQAYISQQLMVLREAGLVDCRRDGLQVYYWLTMEDLTELLNQICGPFDGAGLQILDDCRCPSCTSVPTMTTGERA